MNNYEKLSMEGKNVGEGSFVKTLQGKTGVGFQEGTHVHKDWWKTTISFDEAFARLQKVAEDRIDMKVPAKAITCGVKDGKFVFRVDGRELTPTSWALNTFSTRTDMKKYSSTFLEKMLEDEECDDKDAAVMSYVAQNIIRRLDPNKVFLLRTYKDDTMRAFLTDQYTPIDNRWYLETLKIHLPEARLSHWRSDEDTLFGNLLLPDSIIDYGQSDDSDYGGMLSIGNCEIGKRRISQVPSLFRSICLNGCIWGQVKGKQIRKPHRGKIDLVSLKTEIGKNINEQLPLLPDGVRFLLSLQKFGLGNVSAKKMIASVADQNGFSRKEANETLIQYVQHEKGDRNLFGIVNAVTRAGQKFSNERWVKFDEVGGSFLNTDQKRWDSMLSRADSMDEEEVEKVFQLVGDDDE